MSNYHWFMASLIAPAIVSIALLIIKAVMWRPFEIARPLWMRGLLSWPSILVPVLIPLSYYAWRMIQFDYAMFQNQLQ